MGDETQKYLFKIEKWKTLTGLWDKEADRFWARNNTFLVVNSALLIVVSSFIKEITICIAIAVFGFIFSIFWYFVNKMGKYYLDRWKVILKKLEVDDDINVFGKELPDTKTKFKEPQKYKPSSTYMRYVSVSFALIWLMLIAYNATKIISTICPIE